MGSERMATGAGGALAAAGGGFQGDLRLVWAGRDRALDALLGCDVLVGIDRPDLLELRVLDGGAAAAVEGAALESMPRPGEALRLELGPLVVFAGVVESLALEAEAEGFPELVLRACAAFHFERRAASRVEEYEDESLGDIAHGIALDLGLEPAIGCRPARVRGARRSGDPLQFLRVLGVRHGVDLAVSRGRLHFREDLGAGMGCEDVPARGPLAAWRFELERHGRRRARLEWQGFDARLRPLDLAALAGFGAAGDGRYLLERCLWRLDASGWRTRWELRRCPDA
jgi:hypothetical protein